MNTIQIIEDVVEDIRETASITNIVDNADGTYTVSTADTGTLANNDYVTITGTTGFNSADLDNTDANSAGYKISSLVTNTSFDITKTTGTAIPGTFGDWTANAPYFMKGRWTEITRLLTDKDGSVKFRKQKFPLICLIIPISETKDRQKANPEIETNLTVYFFVETKEDKDTDWRFTNKYSTLETLEELFIKELKKYVIGDMDVEQEWNPHMDGTAYVFTTPVDAWRDIMDVRLYKC